MKTILIPVDFSEVAKNSALYAAGLAVHLGAKKLVLYNAYSMPLATEMSWAILQTEELQKASHDNLEAFRAFLAPHVAEGTELVTISDFGFLAERIETVCEEQAVDIIVMGITGGGKLEQVLIGSNALHVMHHVKVPVVIVPPDANWQPVKNIGWACDYKDAIKTTPAEDIKKIVSAFGAQLVIMHNNPDPKAFDPEMFHNNVMVEEMFQHLKPEFDLVSEENLNVAVDNFVKTREIDLLLVLPRKHGWLESIFRSSHTKQLAFHTHIPLLCLRALGS
jgi:nucleotide-binding universal stress UspA family protein